MLNKKQNEVLWYPRVILLLNFILFCYYGYTHCGEIAYIAIFYFQLILFFTFFAISFKSGIQSGIWFILFGFIQPHSLVDPMSPLSAEYRFVMLVFPGSMYLAGLLLIILPFFFKAKRKNVT